MIEVDKIQIQGRLLARAGDYDGVADIFQNVLKLCYLWLSGIKPYWVAVHLLELIMVVNILQCTVQVHTTVFCRHVNYLINKMSFRDCLATYI
ncbi:hypothetical protein Hdeb2414_s0016g00497011 [Helianthus debilis subsp. tardiflorus]